MCCQFLQLLYEHVPVVANKNYKAYAWFKEVHYLCKGVPKAAPSSSLYLRFSLCVFFFLLLIVGHCIPIGSVCLALLLFC